MTSSDTKNHSVALHYNYDTSSGGGTNQIGQLQFGSYEFGSGTTGASTIINSNQTVVLAEKNKHHNVSLFEVNKNHTVTL